MGGARRRRWPARDQESKSGQRGGGAGVPLATVLRAWGFTRSASSVDSRSMSRTCTWLTLFLPLLISSHGCTTGGVAERVRGQNGERETITPSSATQCKVIQSPRKPMIVEWSSHDRLDLETRLKAEGLVAVRYQGCEMEVLERCRVLGTYQYHGGNVKREEVAIDNEDDLYGKLPMGAFRLETKLRRAGQLNVETVLVGSLRADREQVKRTQLTGVCEGATHFIAGVQVGAFRFFAGGEGEAQGDVARLHVTRQEPNIVPKEGVVRLGGNAGERP